MVPLDLIEWDHLATQGRDHYVKIVYEGYLCPFGHRASLVKVTERKVLAPREGRRREPAGSPVAYLRERMYIVPREHDKSYRTGRTSIRAGKCRSPRWSASYPGHAGDRSATG